MLLELRAENYAVIDRAVATFGTGLNLLTGETGAGKSILIDALALLLGGKASSDVVRHGTEKAVVSCVFELTPGAGAVLEANGIDVESDAYSAAARDSWRTGRDASSSIISRRLSACLRQLAPELALVHSQGETLSSFDQAQQRGSAGSVRWDFNSMLLLRRSLLASNDGQVGRVAVGRAGSAADGGSVAISDARRSNRRG